MPPGRSVLFDSLKHWNSPFNKFVDTKISVEYNFEDGFYSSASINSVFSNLKWTNQIRRFAVRIAVFSISPPKRSANDVKTICKTLITPPIRIPSISTSLFRRRFSRALMFGLIISRPSRRSLISRRLWKIINRLNINCWIKPDFSNGSRKIGRWIRRCKFRIIRRRVIRWWIKEQSGVMLK